MLDLEGPKHAQGQASRYDELLAPAASKGKEASFNRASATYVNLDERFRATKRTYDRQFAQLYYSRLMLLKAAMRARVEQLWPQVPVCSILEVQENKEVAVIGTLYKNMKLKPSILDEYTKDRGMKAALGTTHFCADNDSLVLEDEGARMVLSVAAIEGVAQTIAAAAALGDAGGGAARLLTGSGPLPVHELVTGMVLGVRGVHEPGGDFSVSAVCFPGLAQHARPLPPPSRAALAGVAAGTGVGAVPGDKYVALVSGLCLGGSKVDMLKTQLALDFLTGHLGSPVEQQLSAQIVRLVVAGGCIGQLDALAGSGAPSANHYTNRAAQGAALQPVRDLDLLLAEVAAALPVDVMPGPEDPANVALPQQPMHRCLFPAASTHNSLVRATNPHEFEVEGVRLLGTSGQNLDDMAKYCIARDKLDLMARSLVSRHLAPTAPDTLTCYPFHDNDPFIQESTPHVYFVGNQAEFTTRLLQQQDPSGEPNGSADSRGVAVRLITVPSFARTGTIVLLNLRTLACHPVRFDGSLGF